MHLDWSLKFSNEMMKDRTSMILKVLRTLYVQQQEAPEEAGLLDSFSKNKDFSLLTKPMPVAMVVTLDAFYNNYQIHYVISCIL